MPSSFDVELASYQPSSDILFNLLCSAVLLPCSRSFQETSVEDAVGFVTVWFRPKSPNQMLNNRMVWYSTVSLRDLVKSKLN